MLRGWLGALGTCKEEQRDSARNSGRERRDGCEPREPCRARRRGQSVPHADGEPERSCPSGCSRGSTAYPDSGRAAQSPISKEHREYSSDQSGQRRHASDTRSDTEQIGEGAPSALAAIVGVATQV